MTPERKARLEAAGIDVDALSERVMGSEALMERLLGKFAASRDYPALAAALEEGFDDPPLSPPPDTCPQPIPRLLK